MILPTLMTVLNLLTIRANTLDINLDRLLRVFTGRSGKRGGIAPRGGAEF